MKSRRYEMRITICDPNPDKLRLVKRAVEGEFGDDETAWDDWVESDDRHLHAYVATEHLCGGETEEGFTTRVAHAVWEANGAYCEIRVSALCLEDLPYAAHARNEEDFHRWVEAEDLPAKELTDESATPGV